MIIDTEFNSAAQIPAEVCLRAAELAERQGFGCVWKGESNSRDPMVLLSAMAARTSRVQLGTAIYHVFARSPVSLAIQAATFNEISDGRLILGLGVGNPTIAAWHGAEFDRPLRRMREYVELLRAAYSGERVADYTGDFYASAKGFRLAFQPSHPLRVWVAGLGPQMSTLAGKLGDGVVINMANAPVIADIVARAREGARQAGGDPGALEFVSKIRVSLHPDPAQARWALKKVLTFYSLQKGYAEVLGLMGFADVVTAVQETHRREGFAAARRLIPDGMLDVVPMYAGSSMAGLPARLAEFARAGSTRCVVAYVPNGEDLWGEVSDFLRQADFARDGIPAAVSETDRLAQPAASR